MKKVFSLFVVLFITSTFIISCSNDDPSPEDGTNNEDIKKVVLEATAYNTWTYFNFKTGEKITKEIDCVAGSYTGDLPLSVMGKNQGTLQDLETEVSRISNDSVNITLKGFNFSIGSMSLKGTFTVGAHVEIPDSITYELAGFPTLCTIENSNVTITVTSGSVNAKNDSLVLNLDLVPQGMPFPIQGVYRGILKAGTVDESGFEWDIAVHRDDIRTNGGAALSTGQTDLAKVTSIPAGEYTEDTDGQQIMVDISHMTEWGPSYDYTKINKVLYEFLTRTPTGAMPPYTYAAPRTVFIVKCKDGTFATMQLVDFKDDMNTQFMHTLHYVYPVK
ncbi:HmuY family protein [Parabacteroides pacaensis]|uniref:HmuY family protein n=1 Tax=Parabacteroides pacaensis TaxID=2086575 RepID=UPI000D10443B|nr:HmuY family protein [Parabacteroides pacaensis]